MIQAHGLWWPDGTAPHQQAHALRHVQGVEAGIKACRRRRTAVQAGGNVGLWPMRLAAVFDAVVTFEPDRLCWACLNRNVRAPNVVIVNAALGESAGWCGIARKSLGSHRVVGGDSVAVATVDDLGLEDLDFLQLDLEGYEWHALQGAQQTIARCRPVIQIELRDFTRKYGRSDDDVRAWLQAQDYGEVGRAPGADVVFARAA